MNLSLITKLAMAGVVLTGITGTTTIGNIAGVNHEAKAEVDNPNAEHFKKNVEGHELDFTNALSKDSLSSKKLADEIKQQLEKNGLDPTTYNFKLRVEYKDGGSLDGGGIVTNVSDNQSKEFNPTKDKIVTFDISKQS